MLAIGQLTARMSPEPGAVHVQLTRLVGCRKSDAGSCVSSVTQNINVCNIWVSTVGIVGLIALHTWPAESQSYQEQAHCSNYPSTKCCNYCLSTCSAPIAVQQRNI